MWISLWALCRRFVNNLLIVKISQVSFSCTPARAATCDHHCSHWPQVEVLVYKGILLNGKFSLILEAILITSLLHFCSTTTSLLNCKLTSWNSSSISEEESHVFVFQKYHFDFLLQSKSLEELEESLQESSFSTVKIVLRNNLQ